MPLSLDLQRVRAIRRLVSIAAVGTLTACANSLVPDLNNASINGFQSSPTGAAAGAIAVVLVRGARDNTGNMAWNVGAFGREGYEMGVAQGDLTLYVDGPVNPGTFYLDLLWDQQYADVRSANIVLDGMSRIPDLSAAQKAAMTGFIQTMEAFDSLQLAATRDTFGLPIAVDIPAGGPPAPIADKATVYQHILSLLDSGQTNLQNGGAAFSFTLPPGFTGFNTPATFLRVNRGLRARADILTQNYATALADLAASFMSKSQPLTFGPSFDYSANSGDETNILFKPYYYAANWIHDSAQKQGDGVTLDQRVLNKLVLVPPFTLDNIAATYQFTMYTSVSSPLPMLRNEELILLKAEAEIGTGDLADAVIDINFVRATSGNLPAWTGNAALGQPAALLDELLYEKRYSLLWESGNNWISMRHYGKLNGIPKQYSGEHIFPVIPFPLNDCTARHPAPSGCVTVIGF
jgi:hypothetical protein